MRAEVSCTGFGGQRSKDCEHGRNPRSAPRRARENEVQDTFALMVQAGAFFETPKTVFRPRRPLPFVYGRANTLSGKRGEKWADVEVFGQMVSIRAEGIVNIIWLLARCFS